VLLSKLRRRTCVLLHGRGHLDVPSVRRATDGKPYAGPSAWNSLPDDLRDASFSVSVFRYKLKSHLFADYIECIRGFWTIIRCINSHSHIGLSITYKAWVTSMQWNANLVECWIFARFSMFIQKWKGKYRKCGCSERKSKLTRA